MNATKRKFNALLQGLTPDSRPSSAEGHRQSLDASSRSSSSPRRATMYSQTALSSDASLLQKRRRLGLQDGMLSRSSQAKSPATTIVAASNVASRSGGSRPDITSKSGSKYNPSDRNELLRRLATYQELTEWSPKPDKVSEIEWARRGWVCQGKERVRCVLCSKELVVKLNRKEVDGKEVAVLVASEVEEALVEKYVGLVVGAHQEDCLWRRRGCDDTLLRLPVANASTSLDSLRTRYDELCTRTSFLPYEVNLRLPNDFDLDKILSQMPPGFFASPGSPESEPAPPNPNRVALALALLGWQGLSNSRIGTVPNSASCHTCLRRLGLWMFKSKEIDEDGHVLVAAPMDCLDPVREHRFFCPWKNAATQCRPGAHPKEQSPHPAWEILLQAIGNAAHLRGLYEGRPKSKSGAQGGQRTGMGLAPQEGGDSGSVVLGNPEAGDGSAYMGEDDADRETKDKERWARLRRVKSLFDTKAGRKLRRPLSRAESRPATSHSDSPVNPAG